MTVLSAEQLSTFIKDGVLVVSSVLLEEEIREARAGFHQSLLSYGVDVNDLNTTAKELTKLSSTNGAGGILDLFYADWKLKLNEHPKVFSILQQLWDASYNSNDHDISQIFPHPYGKFDSDKAYMYIDRVCYRLPDRIAHQNGSKKKKALQRSLTPHLDCCPANMFTGKKWKPIQCFIALTDTLQEEEGGFEACKGLHREFDEWTRTRQPSADGTIPCVGQFTPIRPKEDQGILDRMEHIPCRAGDLVCWDYRIAHANAYHNLHTNSREVVYIGLLPPIPLNQTYTEEQWKKYQAGILPSDQWHESMASQSCDYAFSSLGQKLMTIQPW